MQSKFIVVHIARAGTLLAGALLALGAIVSPASAQYRRHVPDPEPAFAVSVSAGALLPFEETTTPVDVVDPNDIRRGLREIGTVPWVVASARFGRTIAVYASASAAFPGDAELSGTDPLTGDPLSGTEEVGMITVLSAGLSFAPLADARGLRLEVGPAWMDLGDGGTYFGVRGGATAKFFAIGDGGGVFLGWNGLFAANEDERDGVEYGVRGGFINGLRIGFEYAW